MRPYQKKSNHPQLLQLLAVTLFFLVGSFSGFAQYQVNGHASKNSCNCYTLTPNSATQVGSVWNINKIDLNNSFDFAFDVYLGCSDGGADGIAFGLQPIGTSVGTNGNGMGMGGVSPSVGVYIDTYQNSSPDFDPAADHVSIQSNGVVIHNGGADDLAGPIDIPNIENCAWHGFRIAWDAGTNTMDVYLDGAPITSYTGDIINTVFGGDPNVYWGFTGATGGLTNLQQVCTKLKAQFTIPSSTACPGKQINFSDVSESFTNITDWQWDFGDGNTASGQNQSHTYASAGNYTVTLVITDATGCTDTYTFQVTIVSAVVNATVNPTDICPGESAQLDASVTPPPLPSCVYSLKLIDSFGDGWNGASVDVSESGTNIGNFTFATGSSETFTFPLTHGNNFDLTFNGGTYNAECSYELYDPSGNLISSGGPGLTAGATLYSGVADCQYVPPSYNFAWTPAADLDFPNTKDPIADPSTTTLYEVKATDPVSGCEATTTVNLTVKVISVSATPTPETCLGDGDGSITLSASAGTAPYSYDLDGTVNTTGLFPNWPDGTYNYTVTDADGCVHTGTITLDKGPDCCPMTNTEASVNPKCGAVCDGTITLTETAGAAPVQFSIDNGTSFQATGVFTDLCAGTFPILIRDNNGCEYTSSITLTAPPALTGSVLSKVDVSCFGDCDGSFEVEAAGGAAPYSYSIGGASQNAGAWANVCPTNYTVTFTDDNGCEGTIDVTVDEPDELVLVSSDLEDASCGSCNGTAIILVQGGTGSLVYTIGQASLGNGSFADLCPGGYVCTVTDENDCSLDFPFTIKDKSGLTVDVLQEISPLCNGDCNGTFEVVGSGSQAPYTYSIGGAFQNSGLFENLCPGTHTITTKDANNCEFPVSVSLTDPPILNAQLDLTLDASCFGICDGEVHVSGTGGTGDLDFTLDANSQATGVFTGLCEGNVAVLVEDKNGCQQTVNAVVVEPTELRVNAITVQNAATADLCDGEVLAQASGGTTPYSFDWSGAGNSPDSSFTDSLCGGDYCVEVSDGNGCLATACTPVTQPEGLNIADVLTHIDCFGNCNGAIDVTVSGGVGPYTYLWAGPAGFGTTDEDIANLCGGNYVLRITDDNGAQATATYTIIEPPALSIVLSGTDSVCFELCNGVLNSVVSGGTPDYNLLWTKPNAAVDSVPSLNNACGGTYSLFVQDKNGCSLSDQITIFELNDITTTTAVVDANCSQADGSGVATAANGVGGYSFTWLNQAAQNVGQSDSAFNLLAGTYYVNITDNFGCTAQDSILVNNIPGGTLTGSVSSDYNGADISCFGLCDGEVTLSMTGGTAPFNYSWNGSSQASPVFTGLCAGNHLFSVTDNVGCTAQLSINVMEPVRVTGNLTVVNESCVALCDGAIDIAGSGGTGSLVYSFDGCTSFGALGSWTNVCPADFTVCVRDANNCVYSESITVFPGMAYANATIDPIDSLCSNTTQKRLRAVDGNGVWEGPGIQDPLQGTFDPATAGPGVHTISYTINTQCGDRDELQITVLPIPIVDFQADRLGGCEPLQIELVNLGAPGAKLFWLFGDGVGQVGGDTVTHTYLFPGEMTVGLEVEDSNGCRSQGAIPEYIHIQENPVAAYGYFTSDRGVSDFSVEFDNHSTGAESYEWWLGTDSILFSYEENPRYLFPDSGLYYTTLVAISHYGCTDTAHVPVRVKDNFTLFIPNTFTPNSDEHNEVFKPVFNDLEPLKYEFFIYDRWGNSIFHTADLNEGWNGCIRGDLVQEGVFVWYVRITDSIEKGRREVTGHVNVLR